MKKILSGDESLSSTDVACQWGWGFHTLRGGIDLEDLCFCPRVIAVVDKWKDL